MVPLLFVDHAQGIGGAEQSLLLLLEHLNSKEWQPHLVCAEGELARRAKEKRITTHILGLPRLRRSTSALIDWMRGGIAIARIGKAIGARIIIANTVRSAFYTVLPSKILGVHHIWYMRDFWLSEDRPKHQFIDYILKLAICSNSKLVIANSDATKKLIPCKHKITIYNGIDLNNYFSNYEKINSSKEKYKLDDIILVGMVGRLRPWKGQERFLRVLAQVMVSNPNVRGIIVGGDPFCVDNNYEKYLKQIAMKLNIYNKIVFTGHLNDIRPTLAAIDIFVHPGSPEPFGLVNIEAMAMGKPIVAFAHGALPEIVIHGQTGLLVPPGDEQAMAEAISALIHDPEQRIKLGYAGQERVKELFTIERTARKFEEVIKSLLDIKTIEINQLSS